MSTTETTESNSQLRILLIVLGALVALAALWFLVLSPLLAGDDPADDEISIDRPDVAEEPVTVDPDAEGAEVLALPIETYEVFLSRDPFEPVIPAFDSGGSLDGGSDGDGGGLGSGDGGSGDGGSGNGGSGDGGSGDGGSGDGGGAVNGAAVIDVFIDDQGEERALIRVGDLLYTVGEGDVFDDDFLVVSIDDPCVTLQQGGQTFTRCEGGQTGGGGGNGGNGGSPDGCSGSDEVVCDGKVVSLVDVFTDAEGVDRAVVQVDATLYEVTTGDTFAENFRVMAIDPPCVTLLFGDDAFTLCEGERVLK